MNLDEYVENCIKTETLPTATSVMVGKTLMTQFAAMRDDSEREVKERGVYLYWNSLSNSVEWRGTVLVGAQSVVQLDTKNVSLHPEYIGDCHTHPYQLKMGAEAAIGPSTNDYREWWYYPPSSQTVALHFVLGGSKIFLVVTRKSTLKLKLVDKAKSLETDIEAVPDDAAKLSEKVNFLVADDGPAQREYMMAFDSQKGKFEFQSKWYEKYLPSIAQDFTKWNLETNLALAKKLKFEYFVGDMGTGTATVPNCQLNLKSYPVHYPYYSLYRAIWG